MEQTQLIAHCGTRKLTRAELTAIPTPEGTSTHRPVPHHEIVGGLVETLSFRHIGVVRDEYAVSPDGMKMFGVLDLETSFDGCRFAIGVRNSNDKSMRLALTVGYRDFVCDNRRFAGTSLPCSPSTPRISAWSMPSRWAWTGCSAISSPCAARSRAGKASRFTRPAPSSLYIERLWKRSWTPPNTWRARSTISTSTRSSRSFSRARCGACRTPSRQPSRNSILSRSSRPRQNSDRSWKQSKATARRARQRRTDRHAASRDSQPFHKTGLAVIPQNGQSFYPKEEKENEHRNRRCRRNTPYGHSERAGPRHPPRPNQALEIEAPKTKGSYGGYADYPKLVCAKLEAMTTAEIGKFLMVCALALELYCPAYLSGATLAKDSNLLKEAAHYKVNAARVLGEVREKRLAKSSKPKPQSKVRAARKAKPKGSASSTA